MNFLRLLRSGESELSQILAERQGPVGALGVRAAELNEMIDAEPDRAVLEELLRRARSVQDDRWVLKTRGALLECGLQQKLLIEHIIQLSALGRGDEAAAWFSSLRRRAMPEIDHDLLHVQVLAAGQHFDNALEIFARHEGTDREDVTKTAAGLVEKLHMARAYDRARNCCEHWMSLHGNNIDIAQQYVKLILSIEGRRGALDALDEVKSAFTSTPEVAHQLRAHIALLAGRGLECIQEIEAGLEYGSDNPQLFGFLIGLIFQGSQTKSVEKLVEAAWIKHPTKGQVYYTRLLWLIATSEIEEAQNMLPGMRALGDWYYRSSLLNIAAFNQQEDDIEVRFRECLEAGIDHGGPEMIYAGNRFHNRPSQERFVECLKIIAPKAKTQGMVPPYWMLNIRMQLAAGDVDDARSTLASLPKGLKSLNDLAPCDAYFAQLDGDQPRARAIWRSHLVSSAMLGLNAKSTRPLEVRLRYRETPGAVLLFLTIFNGIEYAEWLLDSYRALGVDHFFITDNGSDDGTFEYLEAQPDVSLFLNQNSFAEAHFGIYWTNELMQRFGVGHWCFHVDMDELFVFPHMDEGRKLSDFLAYLDKNGSESVMSYMLDIYPERLSQPTDNKFGASTYIDRDYTFIPFEMPPFQFVSGGIRCRMADQNILLTKAPLVRMRPDLVYVLNNHFHSHAVVDETTTALLHYKFVGDMSGRVQEAIERSEHFMGARFYRALSSGMETQTAPSLISEYSVAYESTQQLLDLGLLNSGNKWQEWN